jgi:hypothetical protein
MAENIKVSIELADAAAQKSLNDFITKSKKVDDGLKKVKESSQGTFNEISIGIGKSLGIYEIFAGNIAANVALKAFDLLKDSASALFDTFIVDGVKAAQESEKALNDLNIALRLNGNYSESASKDMQKFAEEVQKTTTFEDDLVIKNIALLQSLTRLDTEGLKRVSTAAINLSSALGRDLGTTTEALAKAANGNVTALKKMGITFEETGSKSRDFQNALKAVEDKFGGAAVASVNTFAGATSQLKNNFGDLLEKIGDIIIKNPAVIAAMKTLSEVFTKFADYILVNGDKISEMLSGMIVGLIESVQKSIPILEGFITSIKILGDTTKILFNLATAGTLTSQLFGDGIVDDLKDIGDGFSNIGDTLNFKLNGGKFLEISGAVTKMHNDIANAAYLSSNRQIEAYDREFKAVETNIKVKKELTEEQQKARQEDLKYVEGLASKSRSIEENQKLELELLASNLELKNTLEDTQEKINYDNKLIALQQYSELKQKVLDDNLFKEEERVIKSIASEDQKNAALLALENKYQVESTKLKNDLTSKSAKIDKSKMDKEKKDRQDTISETAGAFGALASLAAIGGKKNFEIMKAFSLAEALTSGYLAAQKALALGYPMAIPATIAAAATTAANVARITSQQAPSFENGGIVPGSSFTGDRISANVNSGEMILNRRQQSQLFDMVNNGGVAASVSGLGSSIGQVVKDIMSQPIIVNVDGKQLFNITRDQLANGRSF